MDTDQMHAQLEQWHSDGTLVRFGPNWGAWRITSVEPCFGNRDCTPMAERGDCAGIVSVTNVEHPDWRIHGRHVYDELVVA